MFSDCMSSKIKIIKISSGASAGISTKICTHENFPLYDIKNPPFFANPFQKHLYMYSGSRLTMGTTVQRVCPRQAAVQIIQTRGFNNFIDNQRLSLHGSHMRVNTTCSWTSY